MLTLHFHAPKYNAEQNDFMSHNHIIIIIIIGYIYFCDSEWGKVRFAIWIKVKIL